MTKKHFIALADYIRQTRPSGQGNPVAESDLHYIGERVQWEYMRDQLADFCQSQNPRFNRERWIGYINGTNGKNGGKVK